MKKKVLLIIVFLILVIAIIVVIQNRKKDYPHLEKDPLSYDEEDFYLRLMKTVNSTQEGNYLISPYSIEIALNMLKEGSANDTYQELDHLLPQRDISFSTIKKRLGIANSIFLKDIYEDYIEDYFMNTLKEKYHAEVILDAFRTPRKINRWVKTNTYEMIDKILDEMDKDFVLGLANAIAIDVEWETPFDCGNTTEEVFTKSNLEKLNVEMMHSLVENHAEYFEIENAKGIILPYENYNLDGESTSKDGIQLEFVGILPDQNAFDYIENLTVEELQGIDSHLEEVNRDFHVRLSLPRFHYEFELQKFKEVLMSMGIASVFDEEKADFSNIISKENQRKAHIENLYVGSAVHKTYIDLNEKGTKAAAITYFGVFKSTAIMEEPKIVDLNFNHSFVYMIRDHKTKEILFFGVVNEPNSWSHSTCSN